MYESGSAPPFRTRKYIESGRVFCAPGKLRVRARRGRLSIEI
jgi:hypothetical protein